MASTPAVNADPDKVVVIHTARMEWEKTEHPGASEKVLERVGESLILRGIFKDEHHTYEPGTWFRYPIGVPHAPYTD